MGRRNGTAVARRGTKKDLLALLDRSKDQIEAVLPKYMTPERMIHLAVMATTKTPLLLECDPRSIVFSVMQAASLGLEIGGPVPGAHLVPYKRKNVGLICTLIPDYRGLIQLAVEAGSIQSASVRLVYPGEHFKVWYGTDERIEHVPDFTIDRLDEFLTHAYVVFILPSGAVKFEVMAKDEIDHIRATSKAKDSGPWVDWYGEMAKKTIVKRGLKTVPSNPSSAAARRLSMAVEADNRFESGVRTAIVPEWDSEDELSAEAAVHTANRLDDLKARMGAGEEEDDYSGEDTPTFHR